VLVTRASNNYGPYQFPEKLIPLMISNAIEDRPLPIYGDGMQVRDWLHVDDHCRALHAVLQRGAEGEIYNVGGSRALPNREVVEMILDTLGKPRTLMTTVADRPGHDRRYAITTEKLQRATGWQAQIPFEAGLRATIDWYKANTEWTARVKSGEYRGYYERNYVRPSRLCADHQLHQSRRDGEVLCFAASVRGVRRNQAGSVRERDLPVSGHLLRDRAGLVHWLFHR
jgi:dTDP-glucose 4,6-dehydratase